MNGSEICTYSGVIFDPVNPDPWLIDIEDIAHALSQLTRFTGHTSGPYSVAQHSVVVSERLKAREDQQWGLLHDAPEAYINDLARPLKRINSLGRTYGIIERNLEIAVSVRFEIGWPIPESVKDADTKLLFEEAVNFMPPEFFDPGKKPLVAVGMSIWTHKKAERLFLERYEQLFTS
jgi:hypothetical protein